MLYGHKYAAINLCGFLFQLFYSFVLIMFTNTYLVDLNMSRTWNFFRMRSFHREELVMLSVQVILWFSLYMLLIFCPGDIVTFTSISLLMCLSSMFASPYHYEQLDLASTIHEDDAKLLLTNWRHCISYSFGVIILCLMYWKNVDWSLGSKREWYDVSLMLETLGRVLFSCMMFSMLRFVFSLPYTSLSFLD